MKSIEERNAAFQALPLNQKRIKIAQDALSLLLAKRYVAKAGDYFDERNLSYGDQVCDALASGKYKCECCALGALLVGHAWNCDDLTVRAAYRLGLAGDASGFQKRFQGIFAPEQLLLIESAFERTNRNDAHSIIFGDPVNAIEFGEMFKTDRSRLIAILENIIANDGLFVPEASK